MLLKELQQMIDIQQTSALKNSKYFTKTVQKNVINVQFMGILCRVIII